MKELSFSLPKYDEAINSLARKIHKGLTAIDEILSQIQTVKVNHGGTTRQVSQPRILDTEMHHHHVTVALKKEWFAQTNTEEFRDFLWDLHEEFKDKIKKHLFETISQVTETTGNQFDTKGRNFWDAYVDLINTTELTFDDKGNHNYQVVVHPDTYQKIMNNPPSPEQNLKIEEAIKAKQAEYYAKKRTRRLS